jgi:deoxyribodipyrimidine photo-lyase
MSSVMWFRRDLRILDHPALMAAIADGPVVPVFVIDPRLWDSSGDVRLAYLCASLRSLSESLDGKLVIRHGDPVDVIPALCAETGATSVHVSADFAPYGMERDAAVEAALGTIPFVRTGSPYAVAPGRVTKDDGTAYRVFTPFYRAWFRHGWRAPAAAPNADLAWLVTGIASDPLPEHAAPQGVVMPAAGESAAWERWESFRTDALAGYADDRNRPDIDGTSFLSHHLKWGEIHPRSLLADLGESDEVYRKEICWREFYADVLHQAPNSVRESLDDRFDRMAWADDDATFAAWAEGRTGYPFVDAGMRQLRAEGWMHNRVRMVVASFLVKDLHLPWQRGAREFMRWLHDGDIASNTHGWQWTAGCGTDASPFYRVFNPVMQGLKFDPDGDYVRRYIPELAHLDGARAHEPWDQPDGYALGYPERMVDHKAEREVALSDYSVLKEMKDG